MQKLCLLIFLAFALQSTVEAKIYKWVDAQGGIHYTKKKPENKATSVVKVYKNKKPSAQENKAEEQVATKDKDKELTPEQKATKEYNEKERQRVQAVQNRENCKIARKNLETLNNSRLVSKTNPATGEIIYLDNPDRDKMIAQTKAKIQELCN